MLTAAAVGEGCGSAVGAGDEDWTVVVGDAAAVVAAGGIVVVAVGDFAAAVAVGVRGIEPAAEREPCK